MHDAMLFSDRKISEDDLKIAKIIITRVPALVLIISAALAAYAYLM